MKPKERIALTAEKYVSGIAEGRYGKSGDLFITTREMAKENGISVEYANKVMNALAVQKIITLVGKRFYITNGQIGINSPMYQKTAFKKTFGFLTSNLKNAFISGLASALNDILERNGYTLVIRITSDVQTVLDEFLQYGICGVFADPYIVKNYTDQLKFCPLPVVSLGYDTADINRDCVIVDNYHAGEMVADHFLEIGCTRFSYFGFESTNKTDERLIGYKDELCKNGHALTNELEFMLPRDAKGNYDVTLLQNHIGKLVWKTSRFEKTGIFCYHDLLAYDVVNLIENFAFLDKRRTIPADFSVVGFDDLPIASIIKPSLTTVSYPINDMVSKAVSVMLACMSDPSHIPAKHNVYFTLIKRDTTLLQANGAAARQQKETRR